jgi:hypothetical protein
VGIKISGKVSLFDRGGFFIGIHDGPVDAKLRFVLSLSGLSRQQTNKAKGTGNTIETGGCTGECNHTGEHKRRKYVWKEQGRFFFVDEVSACRVRTRQERAEGRKRRRTKQGVFARACGKIEN